MRCSETKLHLTVKPRQKAGTEPPGHALLCFPYFLQGDRPIQPHTFRSEQKSKISTVTTRRSNNDSSIHVVQNQTPGHLQNCAGFKIWKGGGVWKELWKNKNKNKNLSACWFPTFENLVTAARQWPECARHGQCCAVSAVQWVLCRECCAESGPTAQQLSPNIKRATTSSQSKLIDVTIWKYQLLLYLHILWNDFRNRLNIQLFYKNKNCLGLHKLCKIQHHL